VLPFPRRGAVDGKAVDGKAAETSTTTATTTATANATTSTTTATTTPRGLDPAPVPTSPGAARVSSAEASTFEKAAGPAPVVTAPVDGAGGSAVLARLQAMGIEGSRKRTKVAEAPRVVEGAEGRVHQGSVAIESRAGLHKLDGVTRIDGSLSLQEGAVKNADLLALRDLKVVTGRLTFEGMRTV
jgi:hypothetical protein